MQNFTTLYFTGGKFAQLTPRNSSGQLRAGRDWFINTNTKLSNDAMFTPGLALLTWSTIYGLENFDVWDGSELSCIAVTNIAVGKLVTSSQGN